MRKILKWHYFCALPLFLHQKLLMVLFSPCLFLMTMEFISPKYLFPVVLFPNQEGVIVGALIICFGVSGGQMGGWANRKRQFVSNQRSNDAPLCVWLWGESRRTARRAKRHFAPASPHFIAERAEQREIAAGGRRRTDSLFCRRERERVLMLSAQSDVPARRFLSAPVTLISKLPFTASPDGCGETPDNTHSALEMPQIEAHIMQGSIDKRSRWVYSIKCAQLFADLKIRDKTVLTNLWLKVCFA